MIKTLPFPEFNTPKYLSDFPGQIGWKNTLTLSWIEKPDLSDLTPDAWIENLPPVSVWANISRYRLDTRMKTFILFVPHSIRIEPTKYSPIYHLRGTQIVITASSKIKDINEVPTTSYSLGASFHNLEYNPVSFLRYWGEKKNPYRIKNQEGSKEVENDQNRSYHPCL